MAITTFNTAGGTGSKTGSNTGLIIGAFLLAAALGYWHFVWKPEQAAKAAAQPKQ